MAKSKKKRKAHPFGKFLAWLIVLCALAALARFVAYEPVRMASPAMAPLYEEGDIVIVDKLCLWTGLEVHTGDVVYAEFSSGDRLLRRVAAVAGDKLVEDEDGCIYLNGESLGVCPALTGGEIPKGAYLLLADNEGEADSRTLGLVYRTGINGRPYTVIPLGKVL